MKAGNKPPQRRRPVAGGPGREQGTKGTREQGSEGRGGRVKKWRSEEVNE
jgi:hypothetical protein